MRLRKRKKEDRSMTSCNLFPKFSFAICKHIYTHSENERFAGSACTPRSMHGKHEPQVV